MNRRQAIGRIFLTGTGAAALLAGNEWYNITRNPDLNYLDQNKELIAALAETIIPETDTPGAKQAGAQDFIIKLVKDCTESKSQNKFIRGLKDLKLYTISKYNKQYQQCSEEQRIEILQHFEQKGRPFKGILGKVQTRFLGKPFFSTLKEYTVEAYCSSEAGASRALSYIPVPGKYEGCIPLGATQKGWATN